MVRFQDTIVLFTSRNRPEMSDYQYQQNAHAMYFEQTDKTLLPTDGKRRVRVCLSVRMYLQVCGEEQTKFDGERSK